MTVEELIVEVYDNLAQDSNLDPYTAGVVDLTTTGGVRLLKWLNRAYRRVVNWKFPNGQQVKFPCQQGEGFFKAMVLSGTVASATTSDITLDTGVAGEADRYNGCLVEITANTGAGQKRLITGFTAGRLATIDHDWGTIPDVTSTYKVYRREYRFRAAGASDASEHIPLSPVNQASAVLLLTDLKNQTDLGRGGGLETWTPNLFTAGTPNEWIPRANGLVFDVFPSTPLYYRFEYSRIPPTLTLASDEPELPDSFNEALILYATYIGLVWGRENGSAYARKRDIEDIMSSLKQSLELAYDRVDIGAEVY